MKCVILPHGNQGWTRKISILAGLFEAAPHGPFVHNDVLLLVSSSRMKRTYGRIFLEIAEQRGSPALVQPDIRTLHQFMEHHYARLRGPRLIDETSRLVLLEGLVKQRLISSALFGQDPDLLAPSLSAALARMIEQLSASGVAPDDLSLRFRGSGFFDKPQVGLLIDIHTAYTACLRDRGLIDPAGMVSHLLERFDPAWLSPYREIIIDVVPDANRLETAILRRLAECGNSTVLVEAASPDMLNSADAAHPLSITKNFLVAIGASVEPAQPKSSHDDRFLENALFSDRSFDEAAQNAPDPAFFSKDLRLLSAINPREEVSLIARMVKRSLKSGTIPDSVLVAFPNLDEYGPLVEEIFIDYGIPYNRALGRQLSSSAVTTAVISLLSACREDFSVPSLLRVFSSPFLKFADQPSLGPALDRIARARRITGSGDALLAELRRHAPDEQGADILTTPLRDLLSAVQPFSTRDPAGLTLWMDRLSGLIAWSGLDARVALIKGPLNINLQAHKKLIDTLASVRRAGQLFPEYRYTFHEWLFLLKKTFMHARFQVPPEDEGGVQVLGLAESAGHPWSEVYLGGLVDGKFPQRLPQNIFLPESALESLGVRTLEFGRLAAAGQFYRLLLSADTVTLTYPENEGDRPTVASPFLMELSPLRKAGLLNRGVEKTSGIQFSLRPEESQSVPELAKALGLAGMVTGLDALQAAGPQSVSCLTAAVEFKPPEPDQFPANTAKREFRVTELDDYLRCPYDYYIRHVLGLGPLEEVTEDISPLDRGNKVHAILRNFYRAWKEPVTGRNRAEARALLRTIAAPAFESEADTVRNRREKDLFLNRMAERFLDAEEAFWTQGMRPAYLEQTIEDFRLVLRDGTEARLSAKIDRIDLDESGNFMIIDYKTGDYPKPKMGMEQEIFQLPVYAAMAHEVLIGKEGVLREPIGLAYYDLKGVSGAGARDVVLFNKDARNDHPTSKPKASPKSAAEFRSILDQSMDKARSAIEGILKGQFIPAPRAESACRWCPNGMMCEKSDEREE